MSDATIRPAYSMWPQYNRRLRDIVAAMTEEQLAMRQLGHGPGSAPDRWPIWATVGHTACQRVFWLCDFAGEPGAETTPFTDASCNCPGDDDLEQVLSADGLVEALDSTFRIVEGCLDRWTLDRLDEELRRSMGNEEWVHTRGAVLQRVFSHDIYHAGELSQTLGVAGLTQIDLWD
jgi:uncharacterized damage-inducible protein DinB